jgi:tetratricopeptide (TPR) repeat protein
MYNNYLYGMFLNNDKKFSMAIPYLEKATKKVKRDGKYYYPFKELGYSKFMLDDYSGTIQTLNESVAMGDKSVLTIGTLGYCYDKTGDRQKAIDYYQRYLNMKSSDLNMNRLARTRLAKLKGNKKSINTEKSLFDAMDSILKEVQNAN